MALFQSRRGSYLHGVIIDPACTPRKHAAMETGHHINNEQPISSRTGKVVHRGDQAASKASLSKWVPA